MYKHNPTIYISFGNFYKHEYVSWLEENVEWFELNRPMYAGYSNFLGVFLKEEDAIIFKLRFGELRT